MYHRAGLVLSDISTNLERVSDHCSNIAISVIEIDRDGFDAHGYLENLKRDDDPGSREWWKVTERNIRFRRKRESRLCSFCQAADLYPERTGGERIWR